ncbi:TonB-dependent receptor, partial [bacterium AH-315-K03]|nr:TonB-dependent receptor [bacterium AH-315-K03]
MSPTQIIPPTLSKTALALCIASVMTSQISMAEVALEEIVVTAQKRAQSLQDVPISVAAFSGDTLSESGVDSVNDIAMMVPAMRIDQQGSFSQPTVRGVGSSTAGAGFTSNVAVYIDGFYAPSQLTTDMQLLNLSSVQVLKGPQGTLFGRNATGGAILLETLDPSFEPILEAKISAASFGKQGINVYGSTGVSESLAIDLAAILDQGDGYVNDLLNDKDDLGDYERQSIRVSGLYAPDDTLNVELALSFSEVDDPIHNLKGAWQGHTLGALYGPLFGITPVIADGHREVANSAPISFTSEAQSMQLTIEKELGDITFKSFTMLRDEDSHTDLDLDSSNVPVFGVEYTIENETFSQEFNLSGAVDRLEWIAGAFFMAYEETYTNLAATESADPSFPPGTAVYQHIGNDIESLAVFIDGTYELSDALFLTVGLRYSTEEAT